MQLQARKDKNLVFVLLRTVSLEFFCCGLGGLGGGVCFGNRVEHQFCVVHCKLLLVKVAHGTCLILLHPIILPIRHHNLILQIPNFTNKLRKK